MIPDNKVTIDLKEFFSKGTFGCLTLGKTKEWILSHFPDPDELTSRRDAIFENDLWTYGFIQFYFDQDVLVNIYLDFTYLDDYGDDIMDGGQYLELRKWFLNDVKQLKLSHVIEQINAAHLNFSRKTEQFEVLNFSTDVKTLEKIKFVDNGQWNQYKQIKRNLVLIEFESGVIITFKLKRKKNEEYDDFLARWKQADQSDFEMWSFSLSRK